MSRAILLLLSLTAFHTALSSFTSLTLLDYPAIIPANAPFISVAAEIPADAVSSLAEVIVVDIIAKADIDESTQTYTHVTARTVGSPPDDKQKISLIVPLSRQRFSLDNQPYYIHVWLGPAGLLGKQANGAEATITIQNPSKLSHPLAIVSSQIYQTYDEEDLNCVDVEYIGYTLDALATPATGSEVEVDQIKDLVQQGINLFRFALPPPPLTANQLKDLDIANLKEIVDEIQVANGRALIDLPLFNAADAVPFNAVFGATKGEGNIFLFPNPPRTVDSKAILEATASALKDEDDLILLPTQILTGDFGLKNVGAHRKLTVSKSSSGCFVEPFNMVEVKQLTQQLKSANLKGLISSLSAHKDCGNKTHELLDHLASNSDVWYGWVWDSEASYQVAPEYSICKSTKADAMQTIFGGDSKSAGMKFYVLIAIVVACAGVILVLTGFTLWLHLRRQKLEKERTAKGKISDAQLRAQLRQPNPTAKHGRYDEPIKINFVDH